MLRIDTSQLDREESRLFLDHLEAAIREGGRPAAGSAGFEDDGRFVAEINATLNHGEQELPVTWIVQRNRDGTIPFVEVTPQDDGDMDPEGEEAAGAFIDEVLESTLAPDTETFFHRMFYSYIGPRLDGEYWVDGTRLGPYPPDDQGGPVLGRSEQIVLFDQEVKATYRSHSSKVAAEQAHRLAARISLLLGVGLFRPLPELRWVRHEDEEGDLQSERCLLGNPPPVGVRDSMPEKGEEAESGTYSGSILNRTGFLRPTLCFPKESRLILERLDAAPVKVEKGFDQCAKLYQVGLVIGRHFPTAGLAYAVAAVDALACAVRGRGEFENFVREHVEPRTENKEFDELVDRLWGRLRSAHFHAGQFRLGDYDAKSMDLTDIDQLETQRKYGAAHHLLRSTIMSWVFQTLVRPGEAD